MWKVVKDVASPKSNDNWSIKNESGNVVSYHLEIANMFNLFFITKINTLKENIDKDYVEEPVDKLKEV